MKADGDRVASHQPTASVYLVRHGHPKTYSHDAGLTEAGSQAARAFAGRLREPIAAVLHAPAARTRETAFEIAAAAQAAASPAAIPRLAPELVNVRVLTERGLLDPTDARILIDDDQSGIERSAAWIADVERFWSTHADGGDAIGLWLGGSLPAFEAPALTAARYIGLARTLLSAGGAVICCGHSGPIRSVAAAAAGFDPGEPEFLEAARVMLAASGQLSVEYRGRVDSLPDVAVNTLPR